MMKKLSPNLVEHYSFTPSFADEVPKVNWGKVPNFVSSLELCSNLSYKDLREGTSPFPMKGGNGGVGFKRLKVQGENPLLDGVEQKTNKYQGLVVRGTPP